MSKPLSKALIIAGAVARTKALNEHQGCNNDDQESLIGAACSGSALSNLTGPAFARPSTLQVWGKKVPRATKWVFKDLISLREIIFGNWLNVLLVTVPLGIVAQLYGWGSTPVFIFNFLALIPLALILGDITEDLALRFGDAIGGLLNATFGNVVEVILSIAALEKGLYTVVATSLMGSILSNLLLVLGCSYLVGGIMYKIQSFNALSNRTCASLLTLAVIGIAIPTAASQVVPSGMDVGWNLEVSRATAVILLLCYCAYLFFQLHTHKELFDEDSDDGDEEPMLTVFSAITVLTIISLTVAVHSEFLTGVIEDFSHETGLSLTFIGIIIIPIAGNACEHITAVIVAAKNKIDLSMGIALGSSLQIALFAIPFAVVVGWMTGKELTLDFDVFGVIALVLSVIHTNVVTSDANSNWLTGVTLIAVYLLISIIYFYRTDIPDN